MAKAITSVPGGGKGTGKGKGNSSDDVQLILELQDIVTMGDAIGWVQHKAFGSQDFCLFYRCYESRRKTLHINKS